MSKGFNILNSAQVKGAQNVLNDQYQKQVNQASFKSARDYYAGQKANKEFTDMADQADYQAGQKGLDPTIADAYRQQGAMYRMLAQQLQYTDPDKYGETVQRFMASVEDPRKLANELRRTQIMADADIAKAKIYAGANNTNSTGFTNAMYPSTDGLPNRTSVPTGGLFDFGTGLVKGLMGRQ